MNPFNLLINYVIARSRADFYNVPGNQEITNTALLTGMVSENPLISYLIIDNKAKIEGDNFMASNTAQDVKVSTEIAVLESREEKMQSKTTTNENNSL